MNILTTATLKSGKVEIYGQRNTNINLITSLGYTRSLLFEKLIEPFLHIGSQYFYKLQCSNFTSVCSSRPWAYQAYSVMNISMPHNRSDIGLTTTKRQAKITNKK